MATTERFEIIAPLPSSSGFRRALAVDRAGPPRAVVLAFAPARVADDPVRLAALARDAEAAARVRHPNVVPVDGLETVGGAVAVVEPHGSGPSLRDLLDAAGRLPPDIAARVVADACAGLARVHALDPGDGRPLAHGALSPERLVVAGDGATAISGLGAGLGEEPGADVRALAAILHECLAGEPAQTPPRPLDAPGIPPALAAVVDLALGATGGQPLRSAGVLGEAIAAALPLAPREAVAAYAEAILPPDEGERAALARLVGRAVSGEDTETDLAVELLEEGGPGTADATPATTPTPARTPPPGAALPSPSRPLTPLPEPVVIPARTVAPAPAPRPADPPFPPQPAVPASAAAPSPDTVSMFPAPVAAAPRRSRTPLTIPVVCLLVGLGAGFAATRGRVLPDLFGAETGGRQPAPTADARTENAARPAAPVAPAPEEPAVEARAEPKSVAVEPPASPPPRPTRKAPARRVAAAASSAGKGFLVVTAPAEAEVVLDGRRLGKGDVRREIDVGAHRVEVRLGGARVAEQFSISRGETWTYDVTPTAQ